MTRPRWLRWARSIPATSRAMAHKLSAAPIIIAQPPEKNVPVYSALSPRTVGFERRTLIMEISDSGVLFWHRAVSRIQFPQKLLGGCQGGIVWQLLQIVDERFQIWRDLGERGDTVEISVISQIVAELRLQHGRGVLATNLAFELAIIGGKTRHHREKLLL